MIIVRWISQLILKLWGFKIEGRYPHQLKKKLLVVIPHTSNWDYPLGLLVKFVTGAKVKYLAKKSLFKFPLGIVIKGFGGVPVDREKNNSLVDNIVNVYNTQEEATFVIAPEGTRKKVDKLKKGFYHIARLAKVPIIMVRFDFKSRVVEFAEPFFVTGSFDDDFKVFHSYFKDAIGFKKENGIFYP